MNFDHLHVYFQDIQCVAMLKTFNLMLCCTKVGMIMLLGEIVPRKKLGLREMHREFEK